MNNDIIVGLVSMIPIMICAIIWFITFKLNKRTWKNLKNVEKVIRDASKRLYYSSSLFEAFHKKD